MDVPFKPREIVTDIRLCLPYNLMEYGYYFRTSKTHAESNSDNINPAVK
jgi:hypothetical protein